VSVESNYSSRIFRFLQRPFYEQVRSLRLRVAAVLQIWPVRLPFGALWIPRRDNLGEPWIVGNFEAAEISFVRRFLQPGMTVLDLGAHHGLYTLLCSLRVGGEGKVFAFEPSPRERRALRLHIKLNRCKNVVVQKCALGNENGLRDLFVVKGSQTGCNSLRPPIVLTDTVPVRVEITRLDDWVAEQEIGSIDFIKMDVEGGELETLKGAAELFTRRPRPVLLAEVQDLRTRPWGYAAREILEYLAKVRYTWFKFSESGSIEPLNLSGDEFDGNFVGCPEERLEELRDRIDVSVRAGN